MTAARKLTLSKKSAPLTNSETETTVSGGYDPFKQSTLFHEVYLNVEVPHKFKDLWDPLDPKEFDSFCNSFRNLCAEYDFKDFDSWSEIDTIQNWIIPVLQMLGYYDKCDGTSKPFSLDTSFTFEKKTLRPDFIIVDRPSDLKRIKDSNNSPEQKLSEARDYVKLTIEAKYWDRLEEYKQNKVEDKKRANNKKPSINETKDPIEQTLDYMKMLHNDWGILTDGKVWRLYHRDLSNDSQKRCFQFNLGYLAKFAQDSLSSDAEEQKLFLDNSKYFFYLFNKNAIFGREGKGKLLDHLIEYSKEYVHKIEDDLRVRFVQAMTMFCNGLHESMGKPKGEDKLDLIRNVAESHLFNIMFIKSCESRLILPMKGDYLGKSLTRMVQCLKRYKPERQFDDHNLEMLQSAFGNQNDENAFKFTWDGTELYERLMDLTEFVQKGTNSKFRNFKIEGFTETVFSEEEWNTARRYRVSNKYMVAALFEIGYAKPEPKINKYQQIPYNFFTARQLGSIYESFLEFKIDFAVEDIAFIKKQWQKANIKSQKVLDLNVPIAEKGSLFFTPSNLKKKATGAFYTPDDIVQYIVEETLAPLTKNKASGDILKLRVCDPAMGSGHFINASLIFLARKYLEALEKENYDDNPLTLQDAKRKVLHSCIFGVDINPRATKLTKMSLWLESAKAGAKLELLDDQIKCANSLTDYSIWRNSFNFIEHGVDAVVGNPPYKIFKLIPENEKSDLEKQFQDYYNHKNDYAIYFWPLISDILKPNGRFGQITSRYFLDAYHSKSALKEVSNHLDWEKIVNYGVHEIFSASTLTVIFIGSRKPQNGSIDVIDLSKSKYENLSEALNTTSPFTIDAHKLFQNGSGELSQDYKILPFLSHFPKIGSLFKVGAGLQTGCDGVFVLDNVDVSSNKIEKRYLRRTIKNGDIRAFHYYEEKVKFLIFNRTGSFENGSHAHKYLSSHSHSLKNRYEFKKKKCGLYEVAVPRNADVFEQKAVKIIVPYMATDNRFVLDTEGFYLITDVTFISAFESIYSGPVLTSILNSGLYNLLHREIGKLKCAGKYEFISTVIEQYPLIDNLNKSQQQNIEIRYNKILVAINELKQLVGTTKDKYEKLETSYLKFPNYLTAKPTNLENKTGLLILKIQVLKTEIDKILFTACGADLKLALGQNIKTEVKDAA